MRRQHWTCPVVVAAVLAISAVAAGQGVRPAIPSGSHMGPAVSAAGTRGAAADGRGRQFAPDERLHHGRRALARPIKDARQRPRYIVQFKAPPVAARKGLAPKQQTALGNELRQQHEQFHTDLTRIRQGAAAGPGPARGADAVTFHREFFVTLNGVAVHLADDELPRVKGLEYVKSANLELPLRTLLTRSVPQIRADRVWSELPATGKGIVVAILDTGIDYMHPDLGGGIGPAFKVIGGHDFVNNDDDPRDDQGHGTSVAGVVAANGGLKGVAPDAWLMAFKVANASGQAAQSNIIAALERCADPNGDGATDDKVAIANLSLGGAGGPEDDMCQAIGHAMQAGVLCVVAAGNNDFYETVTSPGLAREALTVGATTRPLVHVTSFSSRGPAAGRTGLKPEVCAPGDSLTLPKMGGGTSANQMGTSFAAPHVAGAAALLLELHRDWSPHDIKSALTTSARDLNEDIMSQGAGEIDVYGAAVTEILVTPGILSLGRVDGSVEQWTTEQELSVKNVTSRPVAYQFAIAGFRFPDGLTAEVTPELSLAPGGVGTLRFKLAVDNRRVPALYRPPYVYAGAIVGTSGTKSVRLAFAVDTEPGDQSEPNNSPERAAPVDLSARRTQVVVAGRPRIDSGESGAGAPDEDWFRFEGEANACFCAYVDATDYQLPLGPSFQLYDANRKLLKYGEYVWGDERILFYALPYRGTYYLRVSGRSATEGPYRLSLNLLPPEVRFYWRAPPVDRSNWFSQVRFTGGGQYLVGSQLYDRLSQFRTLGNGSPEFRLHDSSGLYALLDAAAEAPAVVTVNTPIRSDELWTFWSATGKWTRGASQNAPGGIVQGAMAYDEKRNRTVLFGGDHQEWTTCDKTWEWDGNTWSEPPLGSAPRPEPRRWHRLVYDSDRETCVLFGGFGRGGAGLNDTWEYGGQNWTPIPASGPPRSSAAFHGLAFDAGRKRTVLVVHTAADAQTWEYDGHAEPPERRWSGPLRVGTPRLQPLGMCYDAARNRTVLVGGNPPQTWAWSGTGWEQQKPLNVPSLDLSSGVDLVYDPHQRAVLLVAQPAADEARLVVWKWDGADWTPLETNAAPTRRWGTAATYDTQTSGLLLFGGVYTGQGAPQRLEKRTQGSPQATVLAQFDYPDDRANAVAISQDGSRIVLTRGRTLEWYDASGKSTAAFALPCQLKDTSRDGRIVAVQEDCGEGHTAWSLYDLEQRRERLRFPVDAVAGLRLAPRGDYVLRVGRQGPNPKRQVYAYRWTGTAYACLWRRDLGYGEVAPGTELLRQPYAQMAVSEDAAKVVLLHQETYGRAPARKRAVSILLVDGQTGDIVYRRTRQDDPSFWLWDHQNRPCTVSMNREGSLFAVGASRYADRKYAEVEVFSAECGAPLAELPTPGGAAAVATYGTYVAAGTETTGASWYDTGEVYLLDLAERLQHVPPIVTEAAALPAVARPGDTVVIRCRAGDRDGVSAVTARVRTPRKRTVAESPLFDDGQHDDGNAHDGIWAASWSSAAAAAGDYEVDLMATDGHGDRAVYDQIVTFTTAGSPWLRFDSHVLAQGDHVLAGQRNRFGLTVANRGTQQAGKSSVWVSSSDPWIAESTDDLDNRWDIDGLPASEKLASERNAFAIDVLPTAPEGHRIKIQLWITDVAGNCWQDRFDLPPLRR